MTPYYGLGDGIIISNVESLNIPKLQPRIQIFQRQNRFFSALLPL